MSHEHESHARDTFKTWFIAGLIVLLGYWLVQEVRYNLRLRAQVRALGAEPCSSLSMPIGGQPESPLPQAASAATCATAPWISRGMVPLVDDSHHNPTAGAEWHQGSVVPQVKRYIPATGGDKLPAVGEFPDIPPHTENAKCGLFGAAHGVPVARQGHHARRWRPCA